MTEMFEQTGYRVLDCRGANGLDVTWAQNPAGPSLAKRGLLPFLGRLRYIHFIVLAEPRPDEVSG